VRQAFRTRPTNLQGVGEWPSDGLERATRCPACDSPGRAALYAELTDENSRCAPGHWSLWRCSACGTAYLDPAPTRETIGRAYRSYYTHDGLGHEEVSRLGGLLFATLPARPPAIRLLDVGSGSGFLVLRARQLGWDAEGLEPDQAAVQAARSHGVPITQGTVESHEPRGYDVITMNHVIEHMHEPVDALRACRRALRPDGSLWLATPNIGSLGHRVLRTAWYGLDPPRHLAVFSEPGLAAALAAAGFGRVEWRPSVHASEAFVRIRRVLRHRRRTARTEASERRVEARGAPAPKPDRLARRIGHHSAMHAGLRAAELAFPRTADELLVRAWPQ
jgi:2-polyprenyl-3-methyl-5-hydroxy-6-metoxy-1,4-benzoquinol methylase